MQEQDAYIGLPLLLILLHFAKDHRKEPVGKFLLVIFMVFLIASFGPQLWVDSIYTRITLPWSIFVHLPLISSALPARFALFVSLVAAIIAALWIAQSISRRSRRFRLVFGIAVCISLLPSLLYSMKPPYSTFFQPDRGEAALGQKARILILPFAINGPSSLWQQESGFSFTQTGGYLGFPPAAMQQYPVVQELFGGELGPNFLNDIQQFCFMTRTQFIVAGPGTSASLLATLSQLNWPQKKIDDVIVFTVPEANTEVIHG